MTAEGTVTRLGRAPRIPGAEDVPAPDGLPPDATALELARAAIAVSVRTILAVDPDVRLGRDPEAVHDARVAARRMRSHLKTFRPLLDRGWADGLRSELKWFAGALGAVRNAEVLLDRLGSDLDELDDGAEAAAAALVVLEASRASARQELLGAMGSPRYRTLLDALVEASVEPIAPDG